MLFNERGGYDKESIKGLDVFYLGDIKYFDDCQRLQKACETFDFQLTLLECQELYQNRSQEKCAGWSFGIEFMSDEDIYKMMVYRYKELINDRITRWESIEKHLTR